MSAFWDNYLDLCLGAGKSPNAVAKELGFSSGSVTWWKKGRVPHAPSLKKISNYFSVDINILLDDNAMQAPNTLFWKRFVNLCNSHNTTPTQVVDELGLGKGSVTWWRQGKMPRTTTINKIAERFAVSVEYLQGQDIETDNSFWNSFLLLCAEKNKTPTSVVLDLGYSKGTVTHWKNGHVPQDAALYKIADYFSVAVDCLGAAKASHGKSLTIEDAFKIELFGSKENVSEEIWNQVMNYAKFLIDQDKKNRK